MRTMTASISLFLILSLTAMAAQIGSITISGVIPTSTAITVTGTGSYNSLDLTTTQTDLQVATVNEQSNDTAGYKVTLASQNNGALKNGSIGSISYTAQYAGTAVSLSSTAVTVTNTSTTSALVNANKSLTISYTGQTSAALMSGTYADQLTFTISAN